MSKAKRCLTCHSMQYPPPPMCNFCGEPTCADCRREGLRDHWRALRHTFHVETFLAGLFRRFAPRHAHPLSEMSRERFGFCIMCLKVKHLAYFRGSYRCVSCSYEWAPRAIKGQSDPSVMICPFCGAHQKMPLLPAPCARCGMILV